MIEAAGGVIWRPTGTAHVEVLVVHRRRQQDWSLPKGRLRRGETALACAIREVKEETGLRCTVEAELPVLLYRDQAEERLARPILGDASRDGRSLT
jgi:8-oxo-dGTP diphosphatase